MARFDSSPIDGSTGGESNAGDWSDWTPVFTPPLPANFSCVGARNTLIGSTCWFAILVTATDGNSEVPNWSISLPFPLRAGSALLADTKQIIGSLGTHTLNPAIIASLESFTMTIVGGVAFTAGLPGQLAVAGFYEIAEV